MLQKFRKPGSGGSTSTKAKSGRGLTTPETHLEEIEAAIDQSKVKKVTKQEKSRRRWVGGCCARPGHWEYY